MKNKLKRQFQHLPVSHLNPVPHDPIFWWFFALRLPDFISPLIGWDIETETSGKRNWERLFHEAWRLSREAEGFWIRFSTSPKTNGWIPNNDGLEKQSRINNNWMVSCNHFVQKLVIRWHLFRPSSKQVCNKLCPSRTDKLMQVFPSSSRYSCKVGAVTRRVWRPKDWKETKAKRHPMKSRSLQWIPMKRWVHRH